MNRLLLILSAIIFCSCHTITGNGNIKSETREVGGFDKVNAVGSIDIEMVSDNNPTVRVEADDNVLPYIITEVRSGTLEARFKSNIMFTNTHAKVYVSAPGIKKLIVTGSGDIVSKDILKSADEIGMEVNGSGNINVMTDAPSVVADISGSGDIQLRGRTKNFDCSISGSGDIKCKSLLSENTTVTISGSGTAHIFASVSLKAKVNGSGEVYYGGSPAISGGPVHQEK